MKKYNKNKNVYEAAIERINFIFDNYKNIVVSFSGGKDSSVLAYLMLEVAKERGRKIFLFYLDQEIEYDSTINHIDYMMKNPNVIPLWFQIEALLTNTSSMYKYTIDPWAVEKKHLWIRPQKVKSIKKIDWKVTVPYTFTKEKKYGFYGLVQCMEQMFINDKDTALVLGLRADESLDRFRAVTKHPGMKGISWSTKSKYHIKFYPIYDWRFRDIFIYLGRNKLKYNKMYDYFHLKGYHHNKMRLSNLLHEKSYESIADLQEFEPDLFDKMIDRVEGVSTAQEYAGRGGGIYGHKNKLPKEHRTWSDYREYLLASLPNREHAEIFEKRFNKQYQNNYVIKQQVDRILIYDVNNFKPIKNKNEDPIIKIREKWMKTL